MSKSVYDQTRTLGGIPQKTETSNQFDPVQKPAHYNKGKIECIDAIESAVCNLTGIEAICTGNAIKYLWRWKDKGNPIQDLKKTIEYVEKLIKKLENEG